MSDVCGTKSPESLYRYWTATALFTRNSSGDEIANVNFLYDDIAHALQNTIDHISPVLAELHWLLIRQRITFKIAVLVWKCLHDKAPRYLADLCIPVTSVEGRRQLRSALQRLEPFSCPEFGLPLASGASRCSAPQPGTVYLLRYEPPNCRWAPSSACWRLSFSSTREPSSGAVVT